MLFKPCCGAIVFSSLSFLESCIYVIPLFLINKLSQLRAHQINESILPLPHRITDADNRMWHDAKKKKLVLKRTVDNLLES